MLSGLVQLYGSMFSNRGFHWARSRKPIPVKAMGPFVGMFLAHLRKYRAGLLQLRDLANMEFYPLGGEAKELAVYIKTDGHLILTKIETLEKDVPRNM
ncbi:unnamed protein product [Phytophthora fragariaefolia]|uniref:Unnamed protein product n=1 Tax=Phytophthora fragariaefolia TaxID=1490495 RepID=A0A9W7CNI7_9STRA|nr:unnamed protein product [Phytophthora fragariaefolia]